MQRFTARALSGGSRGWMRQFVCRETVKREKGKPLGPTLSSASCDTRNEIHYTEILHANEAEVSRGSRQHAFEILLSRELV